VADRIGASAEGAEPLLVVVRGREDSFVVRADASGDLLHRRGHRVDTSSAPLRETLAAALLALARWDPATPLVDPMCGAGTIPIEAALLALGRPPGRDRGFACEGWPGFPAGVAERVRTEALARVRATLPAPILGFDRDALAIAAARRNAARAGLADLISLDVAGLGAVKPPLGPPGLVLVNPPFGKRVGRVAELGPLYASLRRLLEGPLAGWRAGVLVADKRLLGALGKPTELHRLITGGLAVHLALLEPAAPTPGR
jgi:putative N6-adenine-specific DNA methylase